MVKDAGLACKYIIACKPVDAPVTERAIPVTIFDAEEPVKVHFVRRWLKDRTLSIDEAADIRAIIDWSYYRQRLENAIQKIITIPAACQKISNPVPRVKHPEWLHTIVRQHDDTYKQKTLKEMLGPPKAQSMLIDIEDQANPSAPIDAARKPIAVRRKGSHAGRKKEGVVLDAEQGENETPESEVFENSPGSEGEVAPGDCKDDDDQGARSLDMEVEPEQGPDSGSVRVDVTGAAQNDVEPVGSAKWLAQRRAKWRGLRQVKLLSVTQAVVLSCPHLCWDGHPQLQLTTPMDMALHNALSGT